ncbi:MAG: DUF1840 domain-containing protein [Comamonas sp.]|nr:DUF1840 domain-containing protein [Comamonas sp.]
MYTFQSRAAADLIMLEATGKYLLQLLDKTPGEPGILTVAQIPAALKTLEQAVLADDERRKALAEAAQSPDAQISAQVGAESADLGAVTLRQRVAPLAQMLQQSLAENKDVIWQFKAS